MLLSVECPSSDVRYFLCGSHDLSYVVHCHAEDILGVYEEKSGYM